MRLRRTSLVRHAEAYSQLRGIWWTHWAGQEHHDQYQFGITHPTFFILPSSQKWSFLLWPEWRMKNVDCATDFQLYQIEVNFDEVKELCLGHYQGRSAQGDRRWPLFLSAVQTVLKSMATGRLPSDLPTLNWEWYEREDSVGRVRRWLIDWKVTSESITVTLPPLIDRILYAIYAPNDQVRSLNASSINRCLRVKRLKLLSASSSLP